MPQVENPPLPEFELVIRPRSVVSLGDLADVWRYRELLWSLAMRDVSVRYKQAVLGVTWALLQPVLQMFIFTILFNRMAGIHADAGIPYQLFCLSGLVVWTLFANGLNHASESLVANSNVISKVYFPRLVIPLAAVVTAMVDFAVAFAMVLVLIPIFGERYHLSALLTLPIAMLSALCAASLGLWASAINLQFRDVRYALPFFIQLLIFLTPVFYPASLVPERWRSLFHLNPMVAVVESFRAALFGQPIPFGQLGVATLTILAVALGGFIYFRRMEHTFADRV